MSRENQISQVPLNAKVGNKIQIFVENQGRINYGIMNDFKGIKGKVKLNESPINNWTITGFPFDHYASVSAFIELNANKPSKLNDQMISKAYLRSGPTIFYGTFNISPNITLGDTYLDPTGWGKVFNVFFSII